MPRLTKIYTGKGDDGYTQLGETRIPKDDLLVELVGNLDELNSSIGIVIAAEPKNGEVISILTQIQQDLFDFGGELHVPEFAAVNKSKIDWLEKQIDAWNETLPTLKEFILPRGDMATASCHLARTICRRAERSCVRLNRQVILQNPEMLRYLNRLSDLLFVAARILGKSCHNKEIMWEHEKQ